MTARTCAAKVTVLSAVALTPALDELIPRHESGGNRLTIVDHTIAELKKRIDGSDTADVIVLSRPILDELQARSKLIKGSIVDIGTSYVAIGVRAPARHFDAGKAESCAPRRPIDLLRRSGEGHRITSQNRAAATSSIELLASPADAAMMRSKGMNPA